MQHDLGSMTVQLSLLFLSPCHRFLCPAKYATPCPWESAKKEKEIKKHRVGGGKRKLSMKEVLFLYLDTAEVWEERTGGQPHEDKYAIVLGGISVTISLWPSSDTNSGKFTENWVRTLSCVSSFIIYMHGTSFSS